MLEHSQNPPVLIEGEDRPGRWLVTCDHASNYIPPELGGLGLERSDLARHIAYDIGAWGLARELSVLLDSPLVGANFSRLLIDPNRGEDDPTLIMRLYDGSVIPGNARVDAKETERRLERYHRAYHREYARLAARCDNIAICAIHSFTPQLLGREPRPWKVGILHAHEHTSLSHAAFAHMSKNADWNVALNQPYGGELPGDSIDQHALRFARPNTLIEVRNDLIETPAQQKEWAANLAPHLSAALEDVHADP